MALTPIWGSLAILFLCPLLGGLPLIEWIAYILTGRRLSRLGTGNISVSAAFYHAGKLVGILAVASEAAKGILAVLLARAFFEPGSVWELIALIALVMGRYWVGKGAGTTNVLWGIAVHDWQAALLSVLIGGTSFTIFRDRASGRLVGLFLLALILMLRHPHDLTYGSLAAILAGLLAWIYQKIPDDLDLPQAGAQTESQQVFRFFRGDRALLTLNHQLEAHKVGQKAATLSYLKRLGYPVPDGWILLPGDDPQLLSEFLHPSPQSPLAVRSSAVGEDTETASAAGQYCTVLNVTSPEKLQAAILDCLASYDRPSAVQYRRDRHLPDAAMAVLLQMQIRGVFSGVAFSRDPVNPLDPDVVIEALPGEATRTVSGKVTPEQYRVTVTEADNQPRTASIQQAANGDIPPALIEAVALLARELEQIYHSVPQDLEWTYDGQQIWLLQARSITTLQPIWTRKIAAEVIPGVIRPLTWSLNQPLTCGVWGELFTLVLGKRARDLDFNATATLHYQHAYFNATLLGAIFRRMGLPPESLEFLTRGAKFSKPPFISTLRNVSGLLRLLAREWNLAQDFAQDDRHSFTPMLQQLAAQSSSELSAAALLAQCDRLLEVLRRATYYSILAPLSLALRQALFQVSPDRLDNRSTPEVESLRSLSLLAAEAHSLLSLEGQTPDSWESLVAQLAGHPDGQPILTAFEQWCDRYGYLSDIATDIAVPRWRDNPQHLRDLFLHALTGSREQGTGNRKMRRRGDKIFAFCLLPFAFRSAVQKRLDLKGKTSEVYSRLLAHLRWSFIALEKIWLRESLLNQAGDIFFLTFPEIRHLVEDVEGSMTANVSQLIQQRRSAWERHQQLPSVPYIVYGNPVTVPVLPPTLSTKQQLQGIAASPGQAQGRVKILKNFQAIADIDAQTILVVPYTDSGWAPLLARAGGIIAEVGGSLSHGAIVAREYGIPAVMNVHHATQLLREGQQVLIDGYAGTVEILAN
jgi:pyruvate,water dikinase